MCIKWVGLLMRYWLNVITRVYFKYAAHVISVQPTLSLACSNRCSAGDWPIECSVNGLNRSPVGNCCLWLRTAYIYFCDKSIISREAGKLDMCWRVCVCVQLAVLGIYWYPLVWKSRFLQFVGIRWYRTNDTVLENDFNTSITLIEVLLQKRL